MSPSQTALARLKEAAHVKDETAQHEQRRGISKLQSSGETAHHQNGRTMHQPSSHLQSSGAMRQNGGAARQHGGTVLHNATHEDDQSSDTTPPDQSSDDASPPDQIDDSEFPDLNSEQPSQITPGQTLTTTTETADVWESLTITDLLAAGVTADQVRASKPPTICTSSGCEPLPVAISISFADVFDLNELSSTFRAQGQLTMQWRDSRLIMPDSPPNLTRVQLNNDAAWTPQIDFYNVNGEVSKPVERLAFLGAGADAKLTKTIRFWGDFETRLEFYSYPGDKHQLPIEIEIFGNPVDSVFFNETRAYLSNTAPALPVWRLRGTSWTVDDILKPATGLSYSRFTVRLNVERDITAYMLDMYLPLFLMNIIVYFSFFMDARATPARTSLTIISVLSSFAFYTHVAANLPFTGYITYTDGFCVSTILGAIYALLHFIYVHWLLRIHSGTVLKQVHKKGDADTLARAEGLDEGARGFFPIWIVIGLTFALVPMFKSMSYEFDNGEIE
jgi:hypothetical protein